MSSISCPGTFFKLSANTCIELYQQLSPSEIIVYLYVQSIVPFGGNLNMSANDIAISLSSDTKKMTRQTVSRALKVLKDKGYLDYTTNKGINVSKGAVPLQVVPSAAQSNHKVPVRTTRLHPKATTQAEQESQANIDIRDNIDPLEAKLVELISMAEYQRAYQLASLYQIDLEALLISLNVELPPEQFRMVPRAKLANLFK